MKTPSLLLCSALFFSLSSFAAETWQPALAEMPLPPSTTQLTWSNTIPILLPAFQSNPVVKALIFLPDATDEFYLVRRARADLTNRAPSLLDAIIALTNQTAIRASFQPPLLLLHTGQPPLPARVQVDHAPTAEKLAATRSLPHALVIDRGWDTLEPSLSKNLKIDIRPWPGSKDSWHFYRPCFAAWHLDGRQAIDAVALATKTKATLRRNQIVFELPGPPH